MNGWTLTVEGFFALAALVVVIGFLVWRRDVKAGRVMRTTTRGPVTVMRERFIGRSVPPGDAPASAATPGAEPPRIAPRVTAPRPDAGEGLGGHQPRGTPPPPSAGG